MIEPSKAATFLSAESFSRCMMASLYGDVWMVKGSGKKLVVGMVGSVVVVVVVMPSSATMM